MLDADVGLPSETALPVAAACMRTLLTARGNCTHLFDQWAAVQTAWSFQAVGNALESAVWKQTKATEGV